MALCTAGLVIVQTIDWTGGPYISNILSAAILYPIFDQQVSYIALCTAGLVNVMHSDRAGL